MVCPRCIQSVMEEAENAGFNVQSVKLGKLTLADDYTEKQFLKFKAGIEKNGFELLSNKREKTVEAIKTEIIKVIQHEKSMPRQMNFSTYLSTKLRKDYSYLSNLFSTAEKTTIEKFIILQRIEKTKELLTYNELTLGEIARQLGYSNTQHLSAQFKKVTGISPSQYKNMDDRERQSIDNLGHSH